jgi:uncharacterized protein (TIGR03663 family)
MTLALEHGGRRNVPTRTALNRPVLPRVQAIFARVLDTERLAYLLLLAIAFTMRIWDVGSRAMHHDESLHATYAWYLFKGLGYQYDPLMHGPLQFYVMAFFYMLFGDSETTARLLAVLCGTLIVVLPYFIRREMGRPAALLAATALMISPTFLYYSRFARDDICLVFFALLMVVAFFRFLRCTRNEAGHPTSGAVARNAHRWIYLFAAAAALAMATMEASYILFFVFSSFMGLCVLLEWMLRRRHAFAGDPGDQYLTAALRSVPFAVWLSAFTIFVTLTILLYSTFFSNPYGVFNPTASLLSADRTDILGGLTYWLSQHGVARGGQPWFYYLLLVPLYEQFALVFAAGGLIWALGRRNVFMTFLAYWFLVSFAIYSWAGEKMPWLLLHPLLPAILLAAAFAGWLLEHSTTVWRNALIGLLVVIGLVEMHSAQALAYTDGANPTEMLVYTQTSNDVPIVAHEVINLLHRVRATSAPPFIQVDATDLQGWPFEWYLRNLPTGDVIYSSDFSHPTAPILLMLGPEDSQFGAGLARRYASSQYIWNWWFPEDYKGLTFDDGRCGSATDELACPAGEAGTVYLRTGTPCPADATVVGPHCSMIQDVPAINVFSAISNGQTWQNLWNWYVWRTPFGSRGSRQLFAFVRKDLIPKNSGSNGSALPTPTPTSHPLGPALKFAIRMKLAAATLSAPRGLVVDAKGNEYVSDAGVHDIQEFDDRGHFIRTFGGTGTGAGEFNSNDSPMAVAVTTHGDLYATDFWGHRVEEFGPSGRFMRQWGSFGTSGRYGFYGPRSIAIAPSGNIIVADTGNCRIAVFTPKGRFLFQFGTKGAEPGQFSEPSAVAIGRQGHIYVADYWNSRIQEFDRSGNFLTQWTVPGWRSGSYTEPFLAVLSNGTVAASVPATGAVDVFSRSGSVIGHITMQALAAPVGVAALPHDGLLVSDADSPSVVALALRSHRP